LTKELLIYGPIGGDWMGNGITAAKFAEQLTALGDVDEVTVRINSLGGSVFEGEAIYNLLNGHSAKVNVKIDSVAASAASLIAMAGDKIEMAENAKLMIHNTSVFTLGDRHAHEQQIAVLAMEDQAVAKVYAQRSGKKPAEVAKLMDAETWFTAKDAVANGFADSIASGKKPPSAQFDPRYKAMFKHAPAELFAQVAEPTTNGGPLSAFQLFAPFFNQGTLMRTVNDAGQTPPANPPAPGTTVPAPTNAAPPATPPVTPPAAPPAAPVTTAPTAAATDAQLAAAREEGRKAEAERCGQINALCATAGFQDKAAEWCANPNFSVQNAKDSLFTLMANKGRVNNELSGGGTPENPPPKDPVAGYKAEYAASRAMFEMSGVSEADYVLSRQIDNGEAALLPLKPKQPAAA
jgi:ATP-dependent Clp protease, protease subunit